MKETNEQNARLFVVGALCLLVGAFGGWSATQHYYLPKATQYRSQATEASNSYSDLEPKYEALLAQQNPTTAPAPAIPAPSTPVAATPPVADPCGEHGCNDAGCPKNQYVNGYTKSNGTVVAGYWRNSPNDSC